MARVELVGASRLTSALHGLVSDDMRPMVLREIARRPAMKAANIARHLMPIGDTGKTAKTIGILKVKNPKWTFVEVGFRGRSLGHIYMSGAEIRRQKRGTVRGFPWLFEKTGQNAQGLKGEMRVDVTKLFVKSFQKRGLGR